ncbi:sulfurtransferase [Sulfitobacter guttiformis]|uniref:Thiosulfate/3-mercaptopyruvate sulfurtransferase n=1 Tax=Sulfitobacter guttiformis TaxID=74349 RepID=A0A420DKC7_9RHOB|nr:rhodanese-like domain-containing protein [Sulfitobacter guttiformis]KIN71517.1 Rhodanese domain protein [Sulfitobacter guttiformis KCTC 32187]RKE94645.1 thiosulfate/3-mercaptopyruvate sulfurtransferase [Sulfitobacter guttiformis]
MNRFAAYALAGALVAPLPGIAQTNDFGPLLTPQEFVAVQSEANPLVLDIRAATGGDNNSYAEGHLPGAVNAPYALFRGPSENRGELVPEDRLQETLRGLGISLDRPVLIVHQGSDVTDFGSAARVYWTLKTSGVSQLAILNGGFKGWTEAGLPLEQEVQDPRPSDIEISYSDEWLATREEVLAIVNGEQEATLIDARPESFWKGEASHPAAAKPGTLPQSQYFTHSNWFSDQPVIVNAESAKALAIENNLDTGAPIVSFCNSGHWAATNWFAMSELAGLENVKLYPESMVGWSNAGYEMANVPGPLRRVWNQIKSVF